MHNHCLGFSCFTCLACLAAAWTGEGAQAPESGRRPGCWLFQRDGKPAWLACGRVGGAMLLPLLLFAIWPGTEGRLRRSIASFSVLLAVKVQRCGGFSETKRSLDPWDISALGTATSSLRPGRRSLLRARSSPISTLGPRCSC